MFYFLTPCRIAKSAGNKLVLIGYLGLIGHKCCCILKESLI